MKMMKNIRAKSIITGNGNEQEEKWTTIRVNINNYSTHHPSGNKYMFSVQELQFQHISVQ